jgi:hypothetical protein
MVLVVCAVLTVVVFALVKTWAPAGEIYRVGLSALQWPLRAIAALARGVALPHVGRVRLTRDVTDLVALPAVGIALAIGRARARSLVGRTPLAGKTQRNAAANSVHVAKRSRGLSAKARLSASF